MSRSLADDIRQPKGFESLEHEGVLTILRTAAELEHEMLEKLKPHGITPTQYNVLRILRGAGKAGLCRGDVSSRMITRVPDMTRLLDRMEAVGLIERVRGEADRRFVPTHITRSGLDLLSALDAPMRELHRQQLGHLGTENLERLIDLLSQVREQI